MSNSTIKHSDGINLYVEFSVRAKPIGKIILSILILFTLAAFIIIFSTLDQEEIGKFIIPLSMPCFLFLVIPKRYLIWNLYGKENLIINSKTISYNYDYGFIRTNLKTIPFYHLGTGIELYKENKGIQKVNSSFIISELRIICQK